MELDYQVEKDYVVRKVEEARKTVNKVNKKLEELCQLLLLCDRGQKKPSNPTTEADH